MPTTIVPLEPHRPTRQHQHNHHHTNGRLVAHKISHPPAVWMPMYSPIFPHCHPMSLTPPFAPQPKMDMLRPHTVGQWALELAEALQPNWAQARALESLRRHLTDALRETFAPQQPILVAFGSFASLVRQNYPSTGDIDLCLVLDSDFKPLYKKDEQDSLGPLMRLPTHEQSALVLRIAEAFRESGIPCTPVPGARVPIVKGDGFDISLDFTAVRNSHLIRAYLTQNIGLVQPLAMVILAWSKAVGINNNKDGFLSSYSITLMLIYFLVVKRKVLKLVDVASFLAVPTGILGLSGVDEGQIEDDVECASASQQSVLESDDVPTPSSSCSVSTSPNTVTPPPSSVSLCGTPPSLSSLRTPRSSPASTRSGTPECGLSLSPSYTIGDDLVADTGFLFVEESHTHTSAPQDIEFGGEALSAVPPTIKLMSEREGASAQQLPTTSENSAASSSHAAPSGNVDPVNAKNETCNRPRQFPMWPEYQYFENFVKPNDCALVGKLLFEFFIFYGYEFKWETELITLAMGDVEACAKATKAAKSCTRHSSWSCYTLAIEDPIERDFNPARNVRYERWYYIHTLFTDAANQLACNAQLGALSSHIFPQPKSRSPKQSTGAASFSRPPVRSNAQKHTKS